LNILYQMKIANLIICVIVLLNDGSLSLLATNRDKSIISGIIIDAESGLTLSDVNVFLANTTIGAASDAKGKFRIIHVPDGIHDLIFDRVGYGTKAMKLSILEPESLYYRIELDPLIYDADKIQIFGDEPRQWKKKLKVFTREFIGLTDNARWCKIINPEVLNLRNDLQANKLIATTDSTLIVLNSALGYLIQIKMVEFTYDYSDASCRYEVYPRFVELIPADQGEMNQWRDNRLKSYQGSLRHFLALLIRDDYFPVFKIFISTYPEDRINIKRAFFNFERALNSNLERISFNDFVVINYYSFGSRVASSMLRLDQGFGLTDSLGNIYGHITKLGSWGEDRLAESLPQDYIPHSF
jgi:hypothetical protein